MNVAAPHEHLAELRQRIARAATRAGREGEAIRLVGVTKRQPLERVAAMVEAGLDCIGENYVQEAATRLPALREALDARGVRWPECRFIGQLQRNKAGAALALFDVIETLDRASLGAALERRAAAAGRTLEVLVQVDVSREPQKGGVVPDALPGLLAASLDWPHLRVCGLMAIPAPAPEPEQLRPAFARLRELRDTLRSAPGGAALTELSMGMSADFEVAIEEGATSVRIGSALFGPREA